MKYSILFIFSVLLLACNVTDKKPLTDGVQIANNSTTTTAGADSASLTTLEWIDPIKQDLGTLTKGQVVEITWKFRNSGNKPLVIEDVRPGCGCTIAEKPTEPIAPGGEGVIKAKYDSENGSGSITKEMTVLANNSNRNNGADNKLSFTAIVKE